MNKYQEALDFLLTYPRVIETEGGVSVSKLADAKETLQELIDMYEEELNKEIEISDKKIFCPTRLRQ